MAVKERKPSTLRVLMIDFNPVIREGLRAILAMDYGIELIPDAADVDQALLQLKQASEQGRPVNVVLTETRNGKVDGIQATRLIKEQFPEVAVLVLTGNINDSYVIDAIHVEEAYGLYQSGVQAGERALGKKILEEEVGNFWGMLETRPYMRARLGLAQCLWSMGKREEAIGHYRELLRLNPNDNQGIRYLLAASLVETGEIDAVQERLGKYDEPTADWLYTKTLVTYVKQGDSVEARECLKEALRCNPHVVSYVIGDKKLPQQIPDRVGFGDKDEAVAYAADFGPGWHGIKGAVEWLRANCSKPQSGRRGGGKRRSSVPETFLRAFDPEDRKQ